MNLSQLVFNCDQRYLAIGLSDGAAAASDPYFMIFKQFPEIIFSAAFLSSHSRVLVGNCGTIDERCQPTTRPDNDKTILIWERNAPTSRTTMTNHLAWQVTKNQSY